MKRIKNKIMIRYKSYFNLFSIREWKRIFKYNIFNKYKILISRLMNLSTIIFANLIIVFLSVFFVNMSFFLFFRLLSSRSLFSSLTCKKKSSFFAHIFMHDETFDTTNLSCKLTRTKSLSSFLSISNRFSFFNCCREE